MSRSQLTLFVVFVVGTAMFGRALLAGEATATEIKQLTDEMQQMRQAFAQMKQEYEARLAAMQEKIEALTQAQEQAAEEAALAQELAEEPVVPAPTRTPSPVGQFVQSLNPDISVIIDTYYHNDSAHGGLGDMLADLEGFGHAHGDHDHEHAGLDYGFNLRHVELYLAGEVDPYFRAQAIAAIDEHGAELEEAFIETTCLPAGLQLKAGKFFSGFGRLNERHSHEWDFVDQSLVHLLLFGDHGLNEKGAQLSWLAPTPFHLLAGVEGFQGDNELLFDHLGDDELPNRKSPRVWVQWLKFAPDIGDKHGLQIGVSHGRGVHQEAHDGDDDGDEDHWLDGHGEFWGADFVYKYNSKKAYGYGDFTLEGEYLWRERDLDVEEHLLVPALEDESRRDRQDGFYIQATYGFQPRWRAGLRWDRVGMANTSELPDGHTDRFDETDRWGAMVDFTPTEFSRLRLQLSRGRYAIDGSDEYEWQVFLQWLISLGQHGAHKF